jgi:hypothetical protein
MRVLILSSDVVHTFRAPSTERMGALKSDGSESSIRQGVLLGSVLCHEAQQHEVPASGMADLQVGPES